MITPLEASPQRTRSDRGERIIDCDVHTLAPSPAAIAKHLPARWRSYFETFGMRYPSTKAFIPTMQKAAVARTDSWPPGGGPPGSDLDFTREQLLDRYGIELGILNPQETLVIQNQSVPYGPALARALNEHVREFWLEPESRLRSSICVASQNPQASAKEIRRIAEDGRFVQVLLVARMVNLLGNQTLWPIYEAAVECGLPIAVHTGGAGGHQLSGAGFPSFYIEEQASIVQTYQAQVTSLILEGVFEEFPTLRFLLIEGAASWVGPLAWRLDRAWSLLGGEVPQLTRAPSSYLHDHFWFTTQPVEEPTEPRHFLTFIRHGNLSDRLLFATDYPHWDFDSPRDSLPRSLGPELRLKVLHENAEQFYGLSR